MSAWNKHTHTPSSPRSHLNCFPRCSVGFYIYFRALRLFVQLALIAFLIYPKNVFYYLWLYYIVWLIWYLTILDFFNYLCKGLRWLIFAIDIIMSVFLPLWLLWDVRNVVYNLIDHLKLGRIFYIPFSLFLLTVDFIFLCFMIIVLFGENGAQFFFRKHLNVILERSLICLIKFRLGLLGCRCLWWGSNLLFFFTFEDVSYFSLVFPHLLIGRMRQENIILAKVNICLIIAWTWASPHI